MWTSPAIPIPIPPTDDTDGSEPDPMPWSEATVTERWWDYLHGYAVFAIIGSPFPSPFEQA
jgi:hypothetical protein